MNFPRRLKDARAALGLSQTDAAVRSGVPVGTIRKYEQGPSLPGAEAIEAFVRLGINANWLLTGEGDMLLPGAQDGQASGNGSQAQYLVSEPEISVDAPLGVDAAFLRLCLGACVMVHGEAFAREPSALQLEHAADLYNLLMKQAAAHGQGIKAGLAAFSRLETRGVADQLRLFLKLGWARVYNSDAPAP